MFRNLVLNKLVYNSLVRHSSKARSFLVYKPSIQFKPKLSRSFNVKLQTPNRSDNKFFLIFKSFIFTAGVS